MERRKAFATAGAVSATVLMGVMAVGANIGLFGLTGNAEGPGEFQIVDAAKVVTDSSDDAAPGGSSLPPATSKGSPTKAASTPGGYAPTSTSQYGSDDDQYEPVEPAEPAEPVEPAEPEQDD